MRFSDRMLGGVLIAFALAVGIYSQTFPDIPGQQYGAAAFPTAIAVALGGCGLILFARGLLGPREPLITLTEWTRVPGALLAALVTILAVVAYILLARPVGFVPVMAAILAVLLVLLRVPWWQTAIFAVGTTLVIDFVFRSVLLVPLPLGIMPRLPW
ncbi:tripartite tricarboxylate transporter TctB family protein [Chelativorans salis]|uniref:Tripartite tricarboxylate transporter TctB family protein n=1 Tax=Chelativorans salis TaxID=2978478 RepID=A0ABT2LV33_9HYPH|nr:tripartite tricarboxylate transporter TctB family protein [Chelativorans sp. EGI FJ00035]MCT7377954.1 tripartite tricarboxylate transporter TctB family protein [Chelativorans sp. EGI FJ00035]